MTEAKEKKREEKSFHFLLFQNINIYIYTKKERKRRFIFF